MKNNSVFELVYFQQVHKALVFSAQRPKAPLILISPLHHIKNEIILTLVLCYLICLPQISLTLRNS